MKNIKKQKEKKDIGSNMLLNYVSRKGLVNVLSK